jgi:hypothetical protein
MGYLVGLAVIVVWPNKDQMNALFILFVGVGAMVVAGFAVDRVAFRRSPFDAASLGRRPWRYSLPLVVALGIVLAITNSAVYRYGAVADANDMVLGFAVSVPLLIAGWFLSNVWWVMRSSAAGAPRQT